MPRLSHQEPGTRNANPSLDWADEVDQHIYSVTRQAPGLPPPLCDFSGLHSSSRNPWSSLNFRCRHTLHIKQPMPPIPMFTHTVHNSQSRPPRPHYPASFNNSPHHLYPDHPFPSNRHPSFPGCNCRCHLDHPSRSIVGLQDSFPVVITWFHPFCDPGGSHVGRGYMYRGSLAWRVGS